MRVMMRCTLLATLLCIAGAQASAEVLVVQTNSGGENIHLIDTGTHQIVGEITGVPINHGAAAAPDGSTLYFSSEARRTLEVVDANTLTVTASIPLSGRPNNIFIAPDGKYVYVAIASQPGALDVIDTATRSNVRSIPNNGGVHNVYLTPDGRFIVAGSIAGRNMAVFDAATEQHLWSMFDAGVRPIAFERDVDGSTRNLYVQLSEFHGFVVVDFKERDEILRVELPSVPPEQQDPGPFNGAPAHGIGVAPDGKSLWVCSRLNGHVYAYALPGLDYLGGIPVGKHPDWLTFSPDSRHVYVANGHSDDVSVIDVAALNEIKRIPVGSGPKRNITFERP